MNRLFIAIPIPELVVDKIFNLIESLSDKRTDIKWERKEKIHLTLKFIGEVSNNLIPHIIEQILFINNIDKLKLSFSELNFFPNSFNPKILYIGLTENKIINQIVFELNKKLFEIGIGISEKKFKPHITILRIKKPLSDSFIRSVRYIDVSNLSFIADEISLYESELKPYGSQYKKIKKHFLK